MRHQLEHDRQAGRERGQQGDVASENPPGDCSRRSRRCGSRRRPEAAARDSRCSPAPSVRQDRNSSIAAVPSAAGATARRCRRCVGRRAAKRRGVEQSVRESDVLRHAVARRPARRQPMSCGWSVPTLTVVRDTARRSRPVASTRVEQGRERGMLAPLVDEPANSSPRRPDPGSAGDRARVTTCVTRTWSGGRTWWARAPRCSSGQASANDLFTMLPRQMPPINAVDRPAPRAI